MSDVQRIRQQIEDEAQVLRLLATGFKTAASHETISASMTRMGGYKVIHLSSRAIAAYPQFCCLKVKRAIEQAMKDLSPSTRQFYGLLRVPR